MVEDLVVFIRDCILVYAINMMGDIFNHLFQNKQRMVASSLCTDPRYYSVVIKLVGRMYLAFEYLDVRKHVIFVSDNNKVKSEWDNDKEFVFQYTSNKKAEKEVE